MHQRCIDGDQVLFAVRDATVVFAPRHFGGVGVQIRIGDMVVRPDFSAPQTREE
jgi:hypothetical protein